MKGLMKRSMSRCHVVGRVRYHGRVMVGFLFCFGSSNIVGLSWRFGDGFVELGLGLGLNVQKQKNRTKAEKSPRKIRCTAALYSPSLPVDR